MPQSGAACPERGSDRCGLGLVAGETNELRLDESCGTEHFKTSLRFDRAGDAPGPRVALAISLASVRTISVIWSRPREL